jgi:hypothetical protein
LYLAVLNRGQEQAPGAVTGVFVDDLVLRECHRSVWWLYLPAAW